MRNNRHNRASAIILVAAVLAALVLIGSVFLLTMVSQKKVALANRQAVPMETVVDTVSSLISESLFNDLYIGTSGPYSGDSNWQAYIDYPSPYSAYGVDANGRQYDGFLASTERAQAVGQHVSAVGNWPKLTDLVGLKDGTNSGAPVPQACRDINPYAGNTNPVFLTANLAGGSGRVTFDANGLLRPAGPSDPLVPLVDTDGDGIRDSFLFPTGVFSEDGNQFFAAVRIIDLSAFINANTAYGFLPATTTTKLMSQCLIDPTAEPNALLNCSGFPKMYFGGFRDPIQPSDANLGEAGNVDLHFLQVASRLDNPDLSPPLANFRRFDWSDELACRLAPVARPNMASGRLYQALSMPTPIASAILRIQTRATHI